MAQFDIYQNKNQNTKRVYPYLVDVQSSLLESLETRLVIPLMEQSQYGEHAIKNLTPCIPVKDQSYLVITPQIAAIHKKRLGKPISNANADRASIVASIDFLITGF